MRKFFRSSLAERIISLPGHSSSVAYCNEMVLSMRPLRLPLIGVQSKDHVRALIIFLVDRKQYPMEIFHNLYHHRWPVE